MKLLSLFSISLIHLIDVGVDDSRYDLSRMPIHEFSWWIVIYLLALHTIIAVILTELMSRTYGKWWLWLMVAFCFPLIGPIAIYLYHSIASRSILEARKKSFWERWLFYRPVSLVRALQREQMRAQEVTLRNYNPNPVNKGRINGQDPLIEELMRLKEFGQARAQAWKMLEIAKEAQHQDQIEKYLDYLEIIAIRESSDTGVSFP
jgi:hypothetical protein